MRIYLGHLSNLENKWPWKSWDSRHKRRRSSKEGDSTRPSRRNTSILSLLLQRVRTSMQTQWYIRDNLAYWAGNKMSSQRPTSNNQQTLIGTRSLKTMKNVIRHPRRWSDHRKATTWVFWKIFKSSPFWVQPKGTKNLPYWAKWITLRS